MAEEVKTKKKLRKYIEHHKGPVADVGIAWNENRIWVCIDGAATLRAKIFDGELLVEYEGEAK